jgi:hypothetical protein
MTTLKQQNKLLWLSLLGLFVILFVGFGVIAYIHYTKQQNNIVEAQKVCLSTREYKELVKTPIQPAIIPKVNDDSRDRRVLNDPLYPALNRTEFATHQGVVEQIHKKNLYNTTQEFTDRYRLVAYVTNNDVNKDSGGNTWKLLGRQKNKNEGEFFLVPANNNYDMKIMLKNEMITGERLRDIYTIPKQLSFKTPLLNETPYEVMEIPMTDFTSQYN